MSLLEIVAAGIAIAGGVIFVAGIVAILIALQRRPYGVEMAPIKGSPGRGVFWAFTLGMAPWAKASARLHWMAYLRGVILHLSIFAGAAYLIATPWLGVMPGPLRLSLTVLFAIGAVMGLAGFGIRLANPTMRLLSVPDDYFALALVTLFLVSGAMSAYSVAYLPFFWVVAGITLAYAPFGKLKHFLYFFYARIFLGLVFGRKNVLE